MIARQAAGVALALVFCSAALVAQGCAPADTTAEWFTRQRAWLSEAKHD